MKICEIYTKLRPDPEFIHKNLIDALDIGLGLNGLCDGASDLVQSEIQISSNCVNKKLSFSADYKG